MKEGGEVGLKLCNNHLFVYCCFGGVDTEHLSISKAIFLFGSVYGMFVWVIISFWESSIISRLMELGIKIKWTTTKIGLNTAALYSY